MNVELTGEPLRILDFDCECRPLSWYGGDFVTKDVTAIAWGWIGDPDEVVEAAGVVQSRRPDLQLKRMLRAFRTAYDQADMVTGHFIRGFDLPVLNAACLEVGLGPLGDKLSQDTKLDLMKFSGLSKSQENLGALLGLKYPKVSMDQAKWREANRLTAKGVELTMERVMGDVRQHIELRQRLLDGGMLAPPRLWTPVSSGQGKHHA